MAKNTCVDVQEARTLISDPRYVIEDFIGSGAMACVYKVQERQTPNVYALKLLREEYRTRDQFKEIFQREAIHMRDLQYPNIVRFYKFVIEDKSAYILMDYVDGKPLTDVIREARIAREFVPIDKVVRIMAQVARAISYLHTEGYIHRDIKPGNILLAGENESAFLTDLGIASSVSEPLFGGAGTPSYMPYEQQTRGIINRTVDEYAFAVMLFELLTTQKPFQVEAGLTFNEARKEMVELHRKATVPSLSAIRRDLPKELDAFFERAMAKNPDDRYGDILDFAKDIHEAVLHLLPADLRKFDDIQAVEMQRSVKSEPVSAPVQVQAPPENDNRTLIYGAIAIFVIFILVIGGLLFNQNNALTPTENGVIVITEAPTATTVVDDRIDLVIAEGIDAIGYGSSLNQAVPYIASVRDGIVPLRFEQSVNGFRVRVQLSDDATFTTQRYGLIFRQQDADNYLLFEIDAAEQTWTLNEHGNGDVRVLNAGTIDDNMPLSWAVAAQNDLIALTIGTQDIQETYDAWQSGQVALWFPQTDAATIPIESLDISLIGVDAEIATQSSIEDLPSLPALQFLIEDIRALQATGNQSAIVDCIAFNEIYERLPLHSIIDGAETIISDVQSASAFVATSCQASPDETAFEFGLDDWDEWNERINDLLSDIEDA